MTNHAYAVWDFMSLLKSIQTKVTCTQIPWTPPKNSAACRFINEIVLGEECDDVANNHKYLSHYEMYIKAMDEIGAKTLPIEKLVRDIGSHNGVFWQKSLERNQRTYSEDIAAETFAFTRNSLEVATKGEPHQVISYFVFGREDPIPEMFTRMLAGLEQECIEAPYFKLYLQRHIDIDGDEHGPMSKELLVSVCGEDKKKWIDVERFAVKAIEDRIKLWDGIRDQMELTNLLPEYLPNIQTDNTQTANVVAMN